MPEPITHVYGAIPADLVEVAASAVQCSPRVPGASALGLVPAGSSTGIVVHAPASVVERRRVLAMALRALAPGARLVVVGHNTKGGTRLAKEVEAFGCDVVCEHRRHHRIVRTTRPERPTGLDEAIADGDMRILPDLGLWSQPGLFNWDRIDPGSQLLIDQLPPLTGRGADLGCGIGVLARFLRDKNPSAEMHLIDIDARALDISRRNVPGDGVFLHWVDVRATHVAAATSPSPLGERAGVRGPSAALAIGAKAPSSGLWPPSPQGEKESTLPMTATLPTGLDFVVCNPPFHDGGEEDKALGQVFITRAAEMLRPGGVLWLTANRHLPYEAVLSSAFESVELIADRAGFKVYAATKATRVMRSTRSKPARPGAGKTSHRDRR